MVREEEILIENASPGKPLLIKVSYHPNWKVEGADQIYLASPAFMLVYPDSSRVRLYYGRSWPDYLGAVLSILAVLFLAFYPMNRFSMVRQWFSRGFDRYAYQTVRVSMGLAAALSVYFLVRLSPQFPVAPYNQGIKAFTKKDYDGARRFFRQVMERFPQTIVVDQAIYHYAMCYYREKDWGNAIFWFKRLMETYPETGRASDVLYHTGLCHLNQGNFGQARVQFQKVVEQFPGDIWAAFSKERLQEISLP
jgi:tetratricopeptide (TPR) repeat protein